MAGIMVSLDVSETSFVDRIRVDDLDSNQVYARKWKIESLDEGLSS
jgi:hypothetical protein